MFAQRTHCNAVYVYVDCSRGTCTVAAVAASTLRAAAASAIAFTACSIAVPTCDLIRYQAAAYARTGSGLRRDLLVGHRLVGLSPDLRHETPPKDSRRVG